MNDKSKIDQLAELMNECGVSIWQGVVYPDRVDMNTQIVLKFDESISDLVWVVRRQS